MARLSAPFTLSGTFGNLVAYKRKDLPYTLVRTASTLNGDRFRSDPAFANARRTASEAGGRSKAAQALRRVLQPLSPVRDHNWQGAFTGALTAVQHRDTDSSWGQRNILLSKHGHLLEGFCLSRHTPFESLVRTPVSVSVDKAANKASVELPDLQPGVNLWVRTSEPYVCVVACLGALPDLFFTAEGYAPGKADDPGSVNAAYSEWRPVKSGMPALRLELQLPFVLPSEDFALVLAMGVLLGAPDHRSIIQPVPYRGSGRILKVV